MVSSPLTTPEEAEEFLAAMKQRKSVGATPNRRPPSRFFSPDGGVDGWFMQQRRMDKELKKRRQEAAQLLHGYKGYYNEKDFDLDGWSPRGSSTGRSSFGESASDTKLSMKDPNRRQTSFARLETRDFDVEEREDVTTHRLAPDRTEFLNERRSYDGTGYTKPLDGQAFEEGRTNFNEERDGSTMHTSKQQSKSNMAERLQMRFAEANATIESETNGLSVDTEDAPEIPETVWRDFISDEPGAKFPPEAGRYHLYASYACPGSHRALIVRALKGLEDVVSVTIVHPTWRHTNLDDPSDKHRGWVFGNPGGKPFRNTTGRGGPFPAAYEGNEPDPIFGAYSVRELYEYAEDTSGKFTIPLLWDKKLNTIVNNESSDITYMLNSCFDDFSSEKDLDLYTEDDEEGLDKLNEVSQWLYPMMIHGVYRCGFAKTQQVYDSAIEQLTKAFDMAEDLLSKHRYLTGDTLTDADLRLFVTLLRFDEVYAFYFRANTRLVMMSPTLLNFCREIYQMEGVAGTCHMEQIKAHFYGSHAEWNKYSVIPRGLGFMNLLDQPHNRDELFGEK